jgi:ABC-2 type transport system permease protein
MALTGTAGREKVAEPSAGRHFHSIAWLRWRLFVNSFRRKGGKAELVARVILFPFVALVAAGPILGAGVGGYYAVHAHAAWGLSLLTWGVFAAWVFVTTATTLQPSSVDLTLLLRFPMRFSSYVVARFFFGLLATPNVIGGLTLAAAAIGMGLAEPWLFPWASLVLATYALMMVLLLRMVLLWCERWLAQRRTREILAVVFTLFFLSFQFLSAQMQNFGHSRNGRHSGGRAGLELMAARFSVLLSIYHAVRPAAEVLPPALVARSIARFEAGALPSAAGALAGVLGFAAVFAALFALRLRGEFRGENFNEAPAPAAAQSGSRKTGTTKTSPRPGLSGLPPALAACMEKELRYLLRGPSMLLSILTPLVLIGIYANRMGSFELLLPAAMAYTMFSMMPLLYNVLGQDAAGIQLYMLSPTPIRTVFLAKNIILSALIGCVALTAGLLVAWRQTPPAAILAGTAMWFGFILFTNLAFGNFRSVMAPIKVDAGKIQRRQATSQVSGLIVILVLIGSLAAGLVLLFVCRSLGYIWAAPAVLFAMAIAALLMYLRLLNRIGRTAMDNRDVLIETLGKG